MNIFDIIILVAAAYGIYKGITKGFVHIVLSFAGFLLGLWLAANFSGKLIPYLAGQLNANDNQLRWVAYFVIFLGTLLITWIISKLITKLLKEAGLGWLNRLSGAALATVKYLFIAGLIFILIDEINRRFPVLPQDYAKGSQWHQPVMQGTKRLIAGFSNAKIFQLKNTEKTQDTLR